jgi:hypothetical protein
VLRLSNMADEKPPSPPPAPPPPLPPPPPESVWVEKGNTTPVERR